MLTRVLTVLVFSFGTCLSTCYSQEDAAATTPAPIVPANEVIKDPSSYAIGLNVGGNLSKSRISDKDLDIKDFMLGVMDALERKKPRVSQLQFETAMTAFQARMQKKLLEIAKKNLEKGNAYLEENKKKDGVQVTKSGLQYLVLKSGNGKSPAVTDAVVVQFEGKLIDGTIFDSTLKKGKPETLSLQEIVPGMTEALQRMKVGDKWLLTIPANLGFGEDGADPAIGPNEVLIFDMELLEVTKK